MRFQIVLMGMEFVSFEFAWPARGVFPVPDFIPDELEIIDFDRDQDKD